MTQQRHTLLRRYGGLLAVPVVGVLALGGCSASSGASGSGASSAAGTSFSLTYPVSNNIESPYELLAKSYEKSHAGVKITLNAVPNDSYGSTLRTQLQAGNAADLFYTTPGSGQENSGLPLAAAGFLEPITDAASLKTVDPSSKDLFFKGKDLYLQPVDIAPVGLVFNTGAAGTAGIKYPKTAEELLGDCPALVKGGKSFLAVAGSAPPNTGIMALAISASLVYADNPTWNQDRIAGKTTFAASKGWHKTLQTIVDLKDAGCFQPGVEGGGFEAITNGITQGTSLAAFTPGGAAGDLMRATPTLKLVVETYPAPKGGKQIILASANNALSINAKGKGKEAAGKFLAWLADPTNSSAFAKISGNVPVTGIADAALPAQYEPVRKLLADGAYVPLPNLGWPNPAVYDALGAGVQALLTGQTDVSGVLASLDTAWGK